MQGPTLSTYVVHQIFSCKGQTSKTTLHYLLFPFATPVAQA